MQFEHFDIAGLVLARGDVYIDHRGSFAETWRADLFQAEGIDEDWVQDNTSHSLTRGTIRGLHWQIGQHAQAKLVRVVTGSILDLAVDLRVNSPTFGQAQSVRLNSAVNEQLYVPIGFAHGFCTLEPNTIVAYKVSSHYVRHAERSLLWNDPALKIELPIDRVPICISDKDAIAPTLSSLAHVDLF